MTEGWFRNAYVEVDESAIIKNLQCAQNQLPTDCSIFAVVKANAYGHGAVKVAKLADDFGVAGFCVALLDEAVELRKAGIKKPILVLGVVPKEYISVAAAFDVSVVAISMDYLYQIVQELDKKDQVLAPLKMHIAVDSGMSRIGFRDVNEIQQAADFLIEQKRLAWEGIFTHFATADEPDITYYQKQRSCFDNVINKLTYLPPYIHTNNSAATLWHHTHQTNVVRLGIGMYGLDPSNGAMNDPLDLIPALSLKAELVQVKKVPKGTSISYGATYTTKKAEWIGTVPVGYADGFRRALQGSDVLVNGERCEIVGRICMDQFMIRLPKQFPVGTEVVLFGKSKHNFLPIEELSAKLDTINYEILCGLSERLPRRYVRSCSNSTENETTASALAKGENAHE